MKKIYKTLKAIGSIIKNPWLLNHVLDDNDNWKRQVLRKHNIQWLPVVELDAIIPDFSETLNVFAFLDGSSLPTDIALLKGLCRRIPSCRYFEIGTWRGESVANVAEIAEECYTMDLPISDRKKHGFCEQQVLQHGFFSCNLKNVVHLYGNSLEFDFASLQKKFDVIFIDGNHHYEYVKNDTLKVFKHLVHEQSVVVWHDYAFNPEKIRYEVLAGILDGIPALHKNDLYHVSNTLCAVFVRERFITKCFNPYQSPMLNFKVMIRSERISS